MKNSQKEPGRNLGRMIVESLTEEQLAVLLGLVCQPSIVQTVMDDLEKLDEDLAETLEKIIFPDEGPVSDADPGFAATASSQKILERWRQLWDKWDDFVSELGDEHGRYAEQDNDWEPPYFDGHALASDLETLAEPMLELIDEVFDLVEDEDLFQEALDDIHYNILSYPEYMGADAYDGCHLEDNVTLCALKWSWLASENEENPGLEFLEKVFDLETTKKTVYLSDDQVWEFFTSFPDHVCKEIYAAFTQNASKYKVDETGTLWHRLFHHFESQYDPAGYLETCREHLQKNWRYGFPLIEDAIESENYPEAEKYLVHTFSSLLGRRDKNKWLPERKLLIEIAYHGQYPGEGDKTKLLDIWAQVADKLDNSARKAAALFQAGVFRSGEDWDFVFELQRSLSGPETEKALAPLFESWKMEMVRRSAGYYAKNYDLEDNWVYWLLEARTDVAKKRRWFIEKMVGWIANLNKNVKAFQKNAEWLALFTKEAFGSEKLEKKYPFFFQAAIDRRTSTESMLIKSRKKALAELETEKCLELAVDTWKKRLASMIPSPSDNHASQYGRHALWMHALYEMAPDDYSLVLARWKEKHKRRTNLWRDMKARKLPV